MLKTLCLNGLLMLAAATAMAQPQAGRVYVQPGEQPLAGDPDRVLVERFTGVSPVQDIYRFPIPDFDSAMHGYMHFGLGMVRRNGNGSSSVLVDDDGVLWAEMSRSAGSGDDESPWRYFVVAVNLETGEGFLFADQRDMPLNQVLTMLNKVSVDMHMRPTVMTGQALMAFMRQRPRHLPDPLGETILVDIIGDWLEPDAVLDQVFQQTGCTLDLDESVYFLAGC